MYLIKSVDFLQWLCCYASPSYVHYKLMISGPQSIERNTIFKFESSSVNNGPLSLEFSTSHKIEECHSYVSCFWTFQSEKEKAHSEIFPTIFFHLYQCWSVESNAALHRACSHSNTWHVYARPFFLCRSISSIWLKKKTEWLIVFSEMTNTPTTVFPQFFQH